jgi:hypothetical protein
MVGSSFFGAVCESYWIGRDRRNAHESGYIGICQVRASSLPIQTV